MKRCKYLTKNEVKGPGGVVWSVVYGCIVGSVEVVDCVLNSPSEWAIKGFYHIVCTNAKKFKHPIRDVKGKLGIWEWEGEIEEYEDRTDNRC